MCGVFGVYADGEDVANLTYFGLYALQHRGQESAGIAVSDGETITVVKDMGLVVEAGAANDARTPMAEAARRLYDEGSEQGLGREDDSGVIRLLEGG